MEPTDSLVSLRSGRSSRAASRASCISVNEEEAEDEDEMVKSEGPVPGKGPILVPVFFSSSCFKVSLLEAFSAHFLFTWTDHLGPGERVECGKCGGSIKWAGLSPLIGHAVACGSFKPYACSLCGLAGSESSRLVRFLLRTWCTWLANLIRVLILDWAKSL